MGRRVRTKESQLCEMPPHDRPWRYVRNVADMPAPHLLPARWASDRRPDMVRYAWGILQLHLRITQSECAASHSTR